MLEHAISVIIPTFNRVHMIQRALHSVLNQNFPIHEIIVIDDGSNDGTDRIIQEQFPKVRLLQQDHQGVSVARNRGIRMATGNWIAFLDSDDCWVPNKLSRQIDELMKHPRLLLCHTDEIWIRNGKRVNPKKKHEKKGGTIFQDCLLLCVISPSSVLLKKQLLNEVGYFDEALPVCEDYDLWLRICAIYPVLYINEPLTIKYGGHEDQLSKKYWGMDRFRIQALAKVLSSGVIKGYDKRAACAMLHKKCKILVKGAMKHQNQEIQDYCIDLMNSHPLDFDPDLRSTIPASIVTTNIHLTELW